MLLTPLICLSPFPAARDKIDLLLEHFKYRWRDLLRRLAQTTAVDGRLTAVAPRAKKMATVCILFTVATLVVVLIVAVKASLKVELLHFC